MSSSSNTIDSGAVPALSLSLPYASGLAAPDTQLPAWQQQQAEPLEPSVPELPERTQTLFEKSKEFVSHAHQKLRVAAEQADQAIDRTGKSIDDWVNQAQDGIDEERRRWVSNVADKNVMVRAGAATSSFAVGSVELGARILYEGVSGVTGLAVGALRSLHPIYRMADNDKAQQRLESGAYAALLAVNVANPVKWLARPEENKRVFGAMAHVATEGAMKDWAAGDYPMIAARVAVTGLGLLMAVSKVKAVTEAVEATKAVQAGETATKAAQGAKTAQASQAAAASTSAEAVSNDVVLTAVQEAGTLKMPRPMRRTPDTLRPLDPPGTPTERSSSVMGAYMHDVHPFKLLTREKELELANLSFAGDERARHLLVLHNQRLLMTIAKEFRSTGVPMADLVSEANVGMMKALQYFDPSHGKKISEYISTPIKQHITRELMLKDKTIRTTQNVQNDLREVAYQMRRLADQATSSGKRVSEITIEQVAKEADMPIERVRAAFASQRSTPSIDVPISEHGTRTLLDMSTDADQASQLSKLAMAADRARQEAAIATLPQRQQFVVRNRFGFDGKELTHKEIGDVIGVTPTRAGQLEKAALDTLRKNLKPEHFNGTD